MTVDFHVHSTASDGTVRPAELVARAVRGGFAALALTDHDNCDGVGEARAAAAGKLAFVTGVELSIEPGKGFDKFHLLSLGVDPESPPLKALLSRILEGRNARNRQITANFARLGIDIRPSAHGEVLARPHYARWLAEHGYAADVADAFTKYLLPDSPAATRCYEERWHPPQEETFASVHAAGGIAIMAHPKYWRRAGVDFALAGRELARLKECGLDGVEARYQANTPEEDVGFCRLAAGLGLVMSAGSDFHGANKPKIPLGMSVDEAFIRPLLERLDSGPQALTASGRH